MISYLPREQGGSPLGSYSGQGDTVLAGGRDRVPLFIFPARSLSFLFTPFFLSPRDGERTGVRTESLDLAPILCLCGKKNQTMKWA